MGESQNIAALAERVSNEIFSTFGWELEGEANFNFPCEDETAHQKETSHHHPCDCILSYKDPYSGKRQYFLTDLKSYAAQTLEKKDLQDVLRELSKSVDCATKSVDHFHRNLISSEAFDIHGLLFIHNHDGEFDANFKKKLLSYSQGDLKLPRNARLFVIGPEEISFYYDVRNDLRVTFGADNVRRSISFFHPQQIGTLPKRRIPLKFRWPSATIEALLGPYIVVQASCATEGAITQNIIYYRNTGVDYREFELLIDYCFRYNLLEDASKVVVKSAHFADRFELAFDKAKESFSRLFFASEEMRSKLDRQITVERIAKVAVRYTEHDIGMTRRKEFRRTSK